MKILTNRQVKERAMVVFDLLKQIEDLKNENTLLIDENIHLKQILNGEIRESCGEFCQCVHVGLHLYGEKCNHCGLPISPQNYQERT